MGLDQKNTRSLSECVLATFQSGTPSVCIPTLRTVVASDRVSFWDSGSIQFLFRFIGTESFFCSCPQGSGLNMRDYLLDGAFYRGAIVLDVKHRPRSEGMRKQILVAWHAETDSRISSGTFDSTIEINFINKATKLLFILAVILSRLQFLPLLEVWIRLTRELDRQCPNVVVPFEVRCTTSATISILHKCYVQQTPPERTGSPLPSGSFPPNR